MKKLTNFIYCVATESENTESGILTSAKGILSTIGLDFVPSAFSVSMIFTIMGIDMSSSGKIELEFFDPKGDSIFKTGPINVEVKEDKNMDAIPPEFRGVTATLDVRNLKILTEGIYKAVVSFNEDVIGEAPIYVYKKVGE